VGSVQAAKGGPTGERMRILGRSMKNLPILCEIIGDTLLMILISNSKMRLIF